MIVVQARSSGRWALLFPRVSYLLGLLDCCSSHEKKEYKTISLLKKLIRRRLVALQPGLAHFLLIDVVALVIKEFPFPHGSSEEPVQYPPRRQEAMNSQFSGLICNNGDDLAAKP
uniref:Uncharacterized protein n=1 Tax=Palpitomonas bilix TaxID=652834 RepID=A0A7S3G4C2_9EUKA|mmetsp:Transcript_24554/g.62172  ORF Transcript_24554/g.62172 Transcript_24554/m.62172 type:complete len:115 (+) Transcript_24554:100-444(+)